MGEPSYLTETQSITMFIDFERLEKMLDGRSVIERFRKRNVSREKALEAAFEFTERHALRIALKKKDGWIIHIRKEKFDHH